MVTLGPRIAAAFAAPHVEIDALCLTSVSLNLAVGEGLRQIHAGRLNPAKVDVRVLLPGRDIDLAFPVSVEGRGEDDPVHERWLAQRNAQGQVLQHNLLALRATHGIDVHVSFRALPFTPPVKLYLLNGMEALFAYYTLSRRKEEIDDEHLELYDSEGTQSMLFAFEQGSRPAGHHLRGAVPPVVQRTVGDDQFGVDAHELRSPTGADRGVLGS